MTIGKRLKKLRVDNDLGQKEVANVLNLSISGYCSYESNSRNPTLNSIIKLAKFYNVTTDYILGMDEKTYLDKDKASKQIQELEKQIIAFKQYIDSCK